MVMGNWIWAGFVSFTNIEKDRKITDQEQNFMIQFFIFLITLRPRKQQNSEVISNRP